VKEAPGSSNPRGAAEAQAGILFKGLTDPAGKLRKHLGSITEERDELKPKLLSKTAREAKNRDASPDAETEWERVDHAAAEAAQLRFTAKASDTTVVPGQEVTVSVACIDFGAPNATGLRCTAGFTGGMAKVTAAPVHAEFDPQRTATASFTFRVPEDCAPTLPLPAHLYDPGFLAPQITLRGDAPCGRATLEMNAAVYVDVAPPTGIEFLDSPYLLRLDTDRPFDVDLLLTNYAPDARDDTLHVEGPSGWAVTPEDRPVHFTREDEQRVAGVDITPPKDLAEGDYTLRAQAGGKDAPVEARIRAVALTVPKGIRVGVVQSYDDTFMHTLERMGVPHAAITARDFSPARLDAFNVIIVDIRAYHTRPDLVANNQALLDYVKRGGTLLVMYQKTFEWNPAYAPYPIHVSTNRVTYEDAPVTVLVPGDPVFTTPNPIRAKDWDGWIQERGLYFPDNWDPAYTPLIACNDPGESIPPGSCLVAKYGKGTYLYTALGWYRQLRELHPGALRVFANMLALGQVQAKG
jgi:hypothetical protein